MVNILHRVQLPLDNSIWAVRRGVLAAPRDPFDNQFLSPARWVDCRDPTV